MNTKTTEVFQNWHIQRYPQAEGRRGSATNFDRDLDQRLLLEWHLLSAFLK